MTDKEPSHEQRAPLWMQRIEQDEQRPVRDILEESARLGDYSLADYAREWEVPASTLSSWCRRWGIKFDPNKAPMRYRIYEAPNPGHFQPIPADVREERHALVVELAERLGSQRELARQVGCRPNQAASWCTDYRPVPDRWWVKLVELSQQDRILATTPTKNPVPADNHPWRTTVAAEVEKKTGAPEGFSSRQVSDT